MNKGMVCVHEFSFFDNARRMLLAGVLASTVPCGVGAGQVYRWVGGEKGPWASSDSYDPKGTPGSDDEIELPTGRVFLDASDSDELAAANAVKRIIPAEGTVLEVGVGALDRTLECAFTRSAQNGRNVGALLKTGTGALSLASWRDEFKNSSGAHYDYYANFEVESGSLMLPQDAAAGTRTVLGGISLRGSSAFYTMATAGDDFTYTQIQSLAGDAGSLVTNTASLSNSRCQSLMIAGTMATEFAGRICAPVRGIGSGSCLLTGLSNTMTFALTSSGNYGQGFQGPFVGLMSFGMTGQPSSCGLSGLSSRDYGGAFKYLGSGESTDKELSVDSSYPCFLSGGDTGGLVWTGVWTLTGGESAKMRQLVLAGDGAKTNIMRGVIQNRLYGGERYSFFIRKQGSGIWKMEDSSAGLDVYSQMLGTWGVDEGTLQFTSIGETNFVSALGMGLECFKDYTGAKEDDKRVSYGFVLGSESTEGTLEFVGNKDAICTERPIWLAGDGAFENNGNAKIRFRGVSSVTPEETPAARAVTFTLRGDSGAENEILDVSDDADRPVSVVKEGLGTWVLGGKQAFHGALTVKGGKLIVRRLADYTWHRLTITSKANEGTAGGYNDYLELQEVGLFGADNLRKNVGLELNSNYAALQPGEVAYGTAKQPAPSSDASDIDKLFDDKKTDPGLRGLMRAPNATSGLQRPDVNDPCSWIPITMRLPAGSSTVSSYDIVFYQASTHIRSMTSYFLDGSVDGVHWDRLSTVDAVGAVAGNSWQYQGDSFGAGGQKDKQHAGGQAIDARPAVPFDVLNNVSSVSVDAGAILEAEGEVTISKLAVNGLVGGGTFKNVRLAAAGTLDVLGAPYGAVETGWTFQNCDGVVNLQGWTLKRDGVVDTRRKISVDKDGVVRILPPGMVMIVR